MSLQDEMVQEHNKKMAEFQRGWDQFVYGFMMPAGIYNEQTSEFDSWEKLVSKTASVSEAHTLGLKYGQEYLTAVTGLGND